MSSLYMSTYRISGYIPCDGSKDCKFDSHQTQFHESWLESSKLNFQYVKSLEIASQYFEYNQIQKQTSKTTSPQQ